jgi:uncharacterized protein (DUF2126 family)
MPSSPVTSVPLVPDDIVQFDRRQKLNAIGVFVIGGGVQHAEEAVHVLMCQTTTVAREDHTVCCDHTAKPPTTTNKHVIAVGLHERQEAFAPKWPFRERGLHKLRDLVR